MKPVSSSFSLASMQDDDKSQSVVPRSPLLDKSAINILLLENIHGRAVQMLRDEGYNVETHSKMSPEELLVKIRKAHAIGVRFDCFALISFVTVVSDRWLVTLLQ